MVRYAQRPWYTPLGFMASSPTSYAALSTIIGMVLMWPFRYNYSEFFERQRENVQNKARQEAVCYYAEIERMHRRQAMVNQQNVQEDLYAQRIGAMMQNEAVRSGQLDQEYSYWIAHQRDTIRAEKLMREVRELKQKIAKQG